MGTQKFLKWHNHTIGVINGKNQVKFINTSLNPVVHTYTNGKTEWTAGEYREFLIERIPSRNRRDIEKILFRCGLVDYDEVKIAEVTRALNARDLFWIAFKENEIMEEIIDGVLDQIFIKKVDVDGGSVISPEGINIKRYGVSKGYYGIYKKRLHPMSTDIESEVAVYELSKILGVKCCPAWLVPNRNDTIAFSKFEYNFAEEYIIHARRFFREGERTENEYKNLINKLPAFKIDIQRMIILDFVTRQTDRHLSNLAVLLNRNGAYLYSLYDNGRSLFHEDSERFINEAINNIELYSSEFGPVGTYFDYVQDISKDINIKKLVNLNIPKDSIYKIYKNADLQEHKLEGATEWTYRTLCMLKKL